jgi:hypothetical protein
MELIQLKIFKRKELWRGIFIISIITDLLTRTSILFICSVSDSFKNEIEAIIV